jgi:tRNA-dihydrouridine synthase
MNLFDQLPKPFFVLAPMDDVTDTVFRRIVAACAKPDLFFTEFVNVDGLQSPGRPKLLKKLQMSAAETPLIAQLWGKNPDNFYKTAQQLADGSFAAEMNLPKDVNFAGIDLNMGCPDKSAVKNGTCSALINNRPLAAEIIEATKKGAAGKLPVSVKTRLGFSSIDLSWHEFLLNQSIAMLTIHSRTRKEMSKVPAHWDVLGEICALRIKIAPSTLIVGNGDIVSRKQGIELATRYGLDGIMIGRGIFQDPFTFAKHSSWPNYSKVQKLALFDTHVRLFTKTWSQNERPTVQLNKFCKIYIQGFDGAKELREQFMQAASSDELLALISAAMHVTEVAELEMVGMPGLEPGTNRL